MILLSWFAGFIADRFDRRRTLAVIAVGQAALLVGLAGSLYWHVGPALIVGVIAASTLHTTPLFPAVVSSLPQIVDDGDLVPAGVIVNGAETLSWVAGPAIAGGLLVVFSPVQAILIGSGVSLVAMCTIPRGPLSAAPIANSPVAEDATGTSLLAGLGLIAARSEVLAPVILVMAVNTLLGAGGVRLVLVAKDLLHTGSIGFGVLNSALGVGGIIGLVVSNRLAGSRHRIRTLSGAVLLTGLPFALLAIAHEPLIALVLMLFSGAGSVATEVAALSIVLESLPTRLIGRVFGIVDSLIVGSALFGAVGMPAAVSLVGLRGGLLVFGAVGPALVVVWTLRLTNTSSGSNRSPGAPTNRKPPNAAEPVAIAS